MKQLVYIIAIAAITGCNNKSAETEEKADSSYNAITDTSTLTQDYVSKELGEGKKIFGRSGLAISGDGDCNKSVYLRPGGLHFCCPENFCAA